MKIINKQIENIIREHWAHNIACELHFFVLISLEAQKKDKKETEFCMYEWRVPISQYTYYL